MKATLISMSPGYNLGLAKLANWLQGRGWQTEMARDVRPLTDDADLYAFSVIWSWDVPRLIAMVQQVPRSRDVWIGGPGVAALADMVEGATGVRPVVGPDWRFERQPGNYAWTRTTRGCPVGCAFCAVAKMDGRTIVEYDDFSPARVVVDDNILRASWRHQVCVVERLATQDYPWVDFNSGFDPEVFSADHYNLYARLPLKAWRFAFDEEREAAAVERAITLLHSQGVAPSKIAVYVLVGFQRLTRRVARARHARDRVGRRAAHPAVSPVDMAEPRASLRQSRARLDRGGHHCVAEVLLRLPLAQDTS